MFLMRKFSFELLATASPIKGIHHQSQYFIQQFLVYHNKWLIFCRTAPVHVFPFWRIGGKNFSSFLLALFFKFWELCIFLLLVFCWTFDARKYEKLLLALWQLSWCKISLPRWKARLEKVKVKIQAITFISEFNKFLYSLVNKEFIFFRFYSSWKKVN